LRAAFCYHRRHPPDAISVTAARSTHHTREVLMALVDRVRNICVSPASEWALIAEEQTTPADLTTSYLAPLAAVSAVAAFIGSTLLAAILPFGGALVAGVVGGFVIAIVRFVMTIVGCFVIGFIINALAPTFGGRQDSNQAFKVAVYSYTPVLLAGIFQIIPLISVPFLLIGFVYSIYLTYLGLTPVMKAPPDKTVGYTVVILVCSIILGIVIAAVVAMVAGIGLIGASFF
jgi:hypothetical protein